MASSTSSLTSGQMETTLRNETLKHILKMEQQFRAHYELLTQESNQQLKIVDSLQSIVDRLIEILGSKQRSSQKDELLHQFIEKRAMLLKSNNIITKSATNLQDKVLFLDELVTKLALGPGAHFIVDNKTNTSLDYFAYTFESLYKYFNVVAKRMNMRANQLDLKDEDSLASYRKLVVPSTDYEAQLMVGLNLCKNIDIYDQM